MKKIKSIEESFVRYMLDKMPGRPLSCSATGEYVDLEVAREHAAFVHAALEARAWINPNMHAMFANNLVIGVIKNKSSIRFAARPYVYPNFDRADAYAKQLIEHVDGPDRVIIYQPIYRYCRTGTAAPESGDTP